MLRVGRFTVGSGVRNEKGGLRMFLCLCGAVGFVGAWRRECRNWNGGELGATAKERRGSCGCVTQVLLVCWSRRKGLWYNEHLIVFGVREG